MFATSLLWLLVWPALITVPVFAVTALAHFKPKALQRWPEVATVLAVAIVILTPQVLLGR